MGGTVQIEVSGGLLMKGVHDKQSIYHKIGWCIWENGNLSLQLNNLVSQILILIIIVAC
jgi:hypothetical protein